MPLFQHNFENMYDNRKPTHRVTSIYISRHVLSIIILLKLPYENTHTTTQMRNIHTLNLFVQSNVKANAKLIYWFSCLTLINFDIKEKWVFLYYDQVTITDITRTQYAVWLSFTLNSVDESDKSFLIDAQNYCEKELI